MHESNYYQWIAWVMHDGLWLSFKQHVHIFVCTEVQENFFNFLHVFIGLQWVTVIVHFHQAVSLKKKLYTHKYITACKYELGIHSFKSVLCIFFKQNETLAMKFKKKQLVAQLCMEMYFMTKLFIILILFTEMHWKLWIYVAKIYRNCLKGIYIK